VPQTTGILGWIVLSFEKNIPTCTWCTSRECITLDICLDHRLYGDTIFRAEKVGSTYIISDIWLYNSNCVFMASTFKQRYDWLKLLLKHFYNPTLTKLLHKSDLQVSTKLRGYEVYSNKPGEHGSFVELTNDLILVTKTDIPDVYTVDGSDGYVLVPNLKTSVFLRSKGNTFKLKCIPSDGNWECTENIPEVK